MTFEEAALALDISPNTAASRYRYGLAKLKERLEPLAKAVRSRTWTGKKKSKMTEFEAFLRQFRPSQAEGAAESSPHRSSPWPWPLSCCSPSSSPCGIGGRARCPRLPLPTRRDVRLTTAPNGVPQVDAMLAVYSPAEASERQVNVSLPAVQPRKALSAAPPQYPPEAQRLGLEGMVELRLTVDPAGEVTKTERVTSGVNLRPDEENGAERVEYYSKNPNALVLEAENAAKEWRFEPARSSTAVMASFAFSLKASADATKNPQAAAGLPTLSPLEGLQRPDPAPSNSPVSANSGAQNRRLRVGGAIKPPIRLVNVNPVYPEDAKAAGIEGVVILEIVIGQDGSVIEVQVVRSIPELDQAAIDAVSQWQYQPTLLNGEPVEIEVP